MSELLAQLEQARENAQIAILDLDQLAEQIDPETRPKGLGRQARQMKSPSDRHTPTHDGQPVAESSLPESHTATNADATVTLI